MSIPIIDTLKPLGNFPAVDASDVQVGNERLSTRLSNTPTTAQVDAVVANKVDKVSGKGLSTNDYTTAEKNKLSGIEANANNYVHPTTAGNKHIPAGGSAGKILGWAADGTAQWVDDQNTQYSDATTTTHGLMSAADKAKLNGIEAGATNVSVDELLSGVSTNAIQNKVVKSALDSKANVSDLSAKADISYVVGLSGRISDVETEQSALDARMDTFTHLEEGSTTGDAELIDIRTMADGSVADSAGSAVRTQINEVNDKFDAVNTDFKLVNSNLKSAVISPYVMLTNCDNKRIFDSSIDDSTCEGVAIVNGNNLLYPDNLEIGTKTLSNGATLTVYDDYTIEYDGTYAISNTEITVMSNGAWRYKWPFSLSCHCTFSDLSGGGFNVYAYYNDGEEDQNIGFVNERLTIPANSTLFRVYIMPNNKEVKFKVKININKADQIRAYETPTLRLIDSVDFNGTILGKGVNWIFPYLTGWTKKPISSAESITYLIKQDRTIPGVYETMTQYESIRNALAEYNYANGDYVLVNHGNYNEKITNRNTPKRLIGTDVDTVIIEGLGDGYDDPPIEIASGMIKNLTVKESQSTGAYCVHIDSDEIENQTLIIENCKFVLDGSTNTIGIGNRAGSKIVFKNCEIINNSAHTTVYMHNTASIGESLAQIVFDNCKIIANRDTAMKLQDWSGCCATEFLFINNTFISTDTANAVDIEYRSYDGQSIENSHVFKNKFSLSSGSHGNNVSYLNS